MYGTCKTNANAASHFAFSRYGFREPLEIVKQHVNFVDWWSEISSNTVLQCVHVLCMNVVHVRSPRNGSVRLPVKAFSD
jgi:hypothetical protein